MYKETLNNLPLIEINGRFEPYSNIILNGEKTDYSVTIYGNVISKKYGKTTILKHSINHKGYHVVRLYHNNIQYDMSVHRLVALTFIQNPYKKEQVNHIDGNKSNNSIYNLEWSTNYENMQHAIKHGLTNHLKGVDHGMNKYTNDQIEAVCNLLSDNKLTYKQISHKSNVDINTVCDIKNHRSWTNISSKYNIDNYSINSIYKNSVDQIHNVCRLLEANNLYMDEISNITNVDIHTIKKIREKKNWTKISNQYKIEKYNKLRKKRK